MSKIKITDKYKHFNHQHELTDDHEFVDFGDGEFIANKKELKIKQKNKKPDSENYIEDEKISNSKQNKLFLVSGHSGSGKSTIMKSIMDNEIISVTTRPKRNSEQEGKDYYYITKKQYNELLKNNQLVEHTYYSGNYYGVTKTELNNKLSKGHAFVIVDKEGAQQLLDKHDNCVTIMLHTTKEDAVKQMLERGDKWESINRRMLAYESELDNKKYYDYVVINRHGQIEKTKNILRTIIETESKE